MFYTSADKYVNKNWLFCRWSNQYQSYWWHQCQGNSHRRDSVAKELWQHRIIKSLSLDATHFAAPHRLVIPESSTIFLLLKRGRGKKEWWEDDVQIKLQTEVRRLQKNTEGRVPPSSLPAQRTPVLSNTEDQSLFLFKPLSQLLHCLVGVPLQHSLISTPQGRQMPQGVRSSLVHPPMGVIFRGSTSPAGCLHTMDK